MHIKGSELVLQMVNKKQYLLEEKSDEILETLSCAENQKVINTVGEFRSRIYTPLKTICTFVKQVLSPDKSCKNAVSGLAINCLVKGQKPVSTNTGSYAKARARLPEKVVYSLVKSVGLKSTKQANSHWKPFGREVKVFDGTTISLQDTKANIISYPKHNNAKQNVGLPQLRLVAILSLMTGNVIDYAMGAVKGKGTGETSLLRSILNCFDEKDIAIGDRLFCNFFLTHDLIQKKVDIVFPGHAQRRYDFRVGKRLGNKDHVTVWKKPTRPDWMTKKAYDEYPSEILIREFKVNGTVYITTLHDSSTYPKKELYQLYKRRWEIELHLNSIKTVMGMNSVSCKTPEMVKKEIGIHLLAYNIIRKLIVEACMIHNSEPRKTSFKGTMQIINQLMPIMIGKSKGNKTLYFDIMRLIANNKVGNRPGRVEPRAVKRRNTSFPVLKTSRKDAKETLMTARKKRMDEIKAA